MISDRRVLFLDRDGVITIPNAVDGKGYAPRRLEDFRVYDDAEMALGLAREAGFRIVVVTNQPDISKGLVNAAVVDQMHEQLRASLPIDRIHVCPHVRDAECSCRKPRSGMLIAEANLSPCEFSASWIVGDRDSDLQAGQALGCRGAFIDRGWRGETGVGAQVRSLGLLDAVMAIIRTGRGSLEARD